MIGLSPAAILRGLAVGVLVIAWAALAHYGSAGDGTRILPPPWRLRRWWRLS